MRLTDDDIGLIAERLPPLETVAVGVRDLAASLFENESRRRLYAAATLLQLQTTRLNPIAIPPRTWMITYGFIPLGRSLIENAEFRDRFPASNNFTYGVSVLTESVTDAEQQQLVGGVEIGSQLFPIIVTFSHIHHENLPPHPGSPSGVGSSCCWVRSKDQYSGWDYGVMTARHVIKNLSIGVTVNFDPSTVHASPRRGWVADTGACAIDAAIIEIDRSDWPAVSPLPLGGPFPRPIAAGDPLILNSRSVQSSQCKAISHHPLPTYWGSMMGQRLVVDTYGRGGDSGGLVTTEAHASEGVGLYMGRIDDGAGDYFGLCQDLYQACVYLDVDPYL